MLLAALLPPSLGGGPGEPGSGLVLGTATAQALGVLAVAGWATSPRRGRGGRGLVAEVGLRVRPLDVPLGLGLAVVAVIGLGIVLSLLAAVGLVEPGEVDNSSLVFAGADDPLDLALLTVAVVVVAPLWEEVAFRGLLLRALRRRVGTVGGVLLSSAGFGLLHAQPGVGVLGLSLATGLLGLLLAVVTVRVGRLGPAMALHATFNGATVLALALGARPPA